MILLFAAAAASAPAVTLFGLDGASVNEAARRVLTAEVHRAAAEVLTERGLTIIEKPDLACRQCGALAHSGLWVGGSVSASKEGCRIELSGSAGAEEVEVPCEPERLLPAARALARRISAGARVRSAARPNLSGLPLPDLHVFSISDLWSPSRPLPATATAAADRALALAEYRQRSIRRALDEEGRVVFARGARSLDECQLRQAVRVHITREQQVFCSGNAWIWALSAVPIGGLMAAQSWSSLERGELIGYFGVGAGLIGVAAGAVLGTAFPRFGHGPHEYLTPKSRLEALADDYNARLREELGLAESDTSFPALQ